MNELTLNEAEASWERTLAHTTSKMAENGFTMPDENFLRFSRESYIYGEMSGDYVTAFNSPLWDTADGRLTFWKGKLKEWRIVRKETPELNKFIVDRIREAKSGS